MNDPNLRSDQTSPPEMVFRRLVLAALGTALIALVLGGVIRQHGFAAGCSGGLLCISNLRELTEPGIAFNLAHRTASGLTAVLITIVVIGAQGSGSRQMKVRGALYLAWALILIQSLLGLQQGGWISPALMSGLHYGMSLMVLFALASSAVWMFRSYAAPRLDETPSRALSFLRLALWTLVLTLLLLVSGVWLSRSGATAACDGWPLCNGQVWPQAPLARAHMLHRLLSGINACLMLWLFLRAWTERRVRPATAVAASLAGALLLGQVASSLVLVSGPHTAGIEVLHLSGAALLWTMLAVVVNLAWREGVEVNPELVSVRSPSSWRDYLMLTKPIIVLLLLLTTLSGMVIGAGQWPSWSLVFWTMVGGALTAGGSGALNQYIDRASDAKMQRTAERPLPGGRLAPAEVLSYGVLLCVVGFYVLALLVNLLAALLSLLGILYYVVFYSLILKKTTTQNIVVGGGAGAIPPLVGWAAGTGQLDMAAFFLFALVFFWTPPHFWALALLRERDYARAGIPMLPVVHGAQNARLNIFLYSIQLVALTLLLPVVDIGGLISFLVAVVLGIGLTAFAYRLWRGGGNRVAYGMYRYSSLYLAFLFVAMMIDTLLMG